MSDRHVFVDTNILVYAHDADAGKKHAAAKQKIKALWQQNLPPSISIQVLQELYVNLVRKGAAAKTAREIVGDYLQWDVVVNDEDLLVEAMRLAERYKTSLWDASIIAAAKRAGAAVVWSENFSDKQEYEGVRVENPLR
jgi:predicted nucleic acid-binding protein